MIAISIFVLVILSMIFSDSGQECPAIQKFSASSICKTPNIGEDKQIVCSTMDTIEKLTFLMWVKYPTDPATYASDSDVIFSLYSPTETFRRLTMRYKFTKGLQLELARDLTGTLEHFPQILDPDTDATIKKFRSTWQFLIVSLDYTAGIEQANYLISYFDHESESPTQFITSLKIRKKGDLANIKWGPLLADTKLTIAGYTGSVEVGGCTQLGALWFLPNYVPSTISAGDEPTQKQLITDFMFANSKGSPIFAFNYGFRIKNIKALNFVNECDVPDEMKTWISDSDNSYVQKGIHLAYGDYYECVNSNMGLKEDIHLSVRFYFTALPTINFPLISFLVQSPQTFSFQQPVNGNLPLLFKLIRLGLFLDPTGKLQLIVLGISYELSPVFEVEKGYSVTLALRRIENYNLTGPNSYNRNVMLYVNGILQSDSFTIKGDFGAVSDFVSSPRNHYLYIGDYISSAVDRYNFIFQFPNPKNDVIGALSSERTFTPDKGFIFLHDILIFEDSSISQSSDLIPSNCKLGVPNPSLCIYCNSEYVLDTSYSCKKKEELSELTVYSINQEIFHECGVGLYFQETLKICQNCPSGCAECTSLSSCTIKSSGCPSNCAKCNALTQVCIECNSGFSLDPTSKACIQCLRSNCAVCPFATPNTCTKCVDGMVFDSDSNACINCGDCLTCSGNKDTCTTCPTGKYLTDSKTCLDLPENLLKWKSTEITRSCYPTCKTCSTSSYDRCLSCFPSYSRVFSQESVKSNLLTHTCPSACPPTHYLSYTYQSTTLAATATSSELFCLPCSSLIPSCVTCTVTASKPVCSECVKGYFVKSDNINLYENSCVKCDTKCAECVGSNDNCSACAQGLELQWNSQNSKFECNTAEPGKILVSEASPGGGGCKGEEIRWGGRCWDQCPVGTFRRTKGGDGCTQCQEMTEGCFDCDKNTGVCNQCQGDYKMRLDFTCYYCNQNTVQCCDVDNVGISDGACEACTKANCANCYTKDYCISCNAGFTNTSLGDCVPIIPDCSEYSLDGTTCLQCSDKKFLSAGACIDACDGTINFDFFSYAGLTCEGCESSCQTCNKPLINHYCTACEVGRQLLGGACTDCPNKDNCQSWSATPCACSTCVRIGDKLIDGVCYSTCPEGYFENLGSCVACAGCTQCSTASPAACSGSPPTCLPGYNLLQSGGGSYGCCLPGKYFDGSACQTCAANCDICTGVTAADCTLASAGFYASGGSISDCSGDLLKCNNAGTTLEFSEICRFGDKSFLDSTGLIWSSSCYSSGTVTDCEIASWDTITSADQCIQCSATTFKSIADPSICEAECTTGVGIKTSYKRYGILYSGQICLSILENCATFDEFYQYGCLTCNSGYYLFKTKNMASYFTIISPVRAGKEVTVCAKCHPNCKECIDYSPYACTSCESPKNLFMSMCIDECPFGYTSNEENICTKNQCALHTYKFETANPDPTIAPTVECLRKCPPGYFANNSTISCQQCDASCQKCWGPTPTDCRTCQESEGFFDNGDGTCRECTTEATYPDTFSNFTCAEVTELKRVFATSTELSVTDGQLEGVVIQDSTGQTQALVINADGFIGVNFGYELTLPSFKYEDPKRTCYRSLVQFDLRLQGYEDWHGKIIDIKNGENSLATIPVNKWDFEDYKGTFDAVAPSNFYEKTVKRIYFDNFECATKDITLHISSNLEANAVFLLRNFRIMYFKCPIDCISCLDSKSCTNCVEGEFFYQEKNSCTLPYDSLKENDFTILEIKSFLFRPRSFYLLFNQAMNFTLDTPKTYFFPVVTVGTSVTSTSTTGRLLQRTVEASQLAMNFRGSNLLEIEILDYLEERATESSLSFRYPLVSLNKTGYSYSSIKANMIGNNLTRTKFSEYIDKLTKNENITMPIFTGLPLFFISSLGGNWLFLDCAQKLYLMFFINVQHAGDIEDLLHFMRFSFFSWYQKATQKIMGDSVYWDKTKYEEYITRDSKTEMIESDFVNFIPDLKLGQYKVRKAFLINMDIVCLGFVFFLILYCLFKPVAWFIKCKYYYKENLMKNVENINNLFVCKLFTRYVLFTFAPIIFYAVGNMTFIDTSDPIGARTAYATYLFLGVWILFLILMLCSALLHPFPKDMDLNDPCTSRRRGYSVLFNHFMKFTKNPDKLTLEELSSGNNFGTVKSKKAKITPSDRPIINPIGATTLKSTGFSLATGRVENAASKRIVSPEGQLPESQPDPVRLSVSSSSSLPPRTRLPFKNIKRLQREKEAERVRREKEEEKKKKKELKNKEKNNHSQKIPLDIKDSDSHSKVPLGELPEGQEPDGQEPDGQESEIDQSDGESEEDESDEDEQEDNDRLDNMEEFGKLLGATVVKMERSGQCCYCKCLSNNKCLQMTNNILERTSKYYPIAKCLHSVFLAYLAWNYQERPTDHAFNALIAQGILFAWFILARPWKTIWLNLIAGFTELLFVGFAVISWKMTEEVDAAKIDFYYQYGAICVIAIFFLSFAGFLLLTMSNLIQWCKEMSKAERL